MVFALLQTSKSEYYCTVKPFTTQEEFTKSRKLIHDEFVLHSMLGTLDMMKKEISKQYYTIKDVLIDKRKVILEKVLIKRLLKTAKMYQDLYEDLRGPVSQLAAMGMDIPDVFRISARFCILKELDETLSEADDFLDEKLNTSLSELKEDADKFFINLNKSRAGVIIAKKLQKLIENVADDPNDKTSAQIFAIFNLIDKLRLNVDIKVAQNIYYEKIYSKIEYLIEYLEKSKHKNKDRKIILSFLEIGKKLNINTDFYIPHIDKASLPNGGAHIKS